MSRAPSEPGQALQFETPASASHGTEPNADSEYSSCSSDSDPDGEDMIRVTGISVVDYAPEYLLALPSVSLTEATEPRTRAAIPSSHLEPITGRKVSSPLTPLDSEMGSGFGGTISGRAER